MCTKRYIRIGLFLSFLGLISTPAFSQSPSFGKAKRLFKSGQFRPACDMYTLLINEQTDLEGVLLRAGQACLECSEVQKAHDYFKQISATQKRFGDEVIFYTAKADHFLGRHEDALKGYKTFLHKSSRKNDLRGECKQLMIQAWKASLVKKQARLALVQNAGPNINSQFPETRPVPSPSIANKYYYAKADSTSTGGLRDEKGRIDQKDGIYRFDIFTAELQNGNWVEHHSVDPFLNTSMHDLVVDISDDGQIMYFKKGLDLDNCEVVADTFQTSGNTFRDQGKFVGPLRSTDSHFDIWQDSIIIFSGTRKGGYGGKDLYVSIKQKGRWSFPRNMGPTINTPDDEDYPFLTFDGKKLFFSSNGDKSIGGYDVLYSTYDTDLDYWGHAVNAGLGINSYFDDIGYRLTTDGQLGILASNRSGGFGDFDIYLAYLKSKEFAQLGSPDLSGFNHLTESGSSIKKNSSTASDPKSSPKENNEKSNQRGLIHMPVLFDVNDGFLGINENRQKAEYLLIPLNKMPNSKLVLTVHSSRNKTSSQALFFGATYAKELKAFLVENGVDDSRIILKSVGSKYPLVKMVGPTVSQQELRFNNRIETRIIRHPEDLMYELDYEEVPVPNALRTEEKWSTITGLNYRILIERSEQMVMNSALTTNDNVVIEQESDGPFTYLVEGFLDYGSAQKERINWIEKGYLSAEVLPYVGERLIERKNMVDMARIYPDLLNYLSDN